jgi:hypothetical protein
MDSELSRTIKYRACISGRCSIDHIAAMGTEIPTSRIFQRQKSDATPITQRAAHYPHTVIAAVASKTLFILVAGFAKIAL